MAKLDTLLALKKLYRNYMEIAFNMVIGKPLNTVLPAKFRFNNEIVYLSLGSLIQITVLYNSKLIDINQQFFQNLRNGILEFTYNNQKVRFLLENISGTYSIGDVASIFVNDVYKSDVTDKDVVDVGAETGDSSIYFAINGARKVIALEPFPQNYQTAIKNIRLNNLTQKIILLNAGISSEMGNIFIKDEKREWVMDLRQEEGGSIQIPVYKLEYILTQYNLDNILLKMDCEGCEYAAILNSPISVFEKIDEIIMEYHYGYEKLVEKLKSAGFMVEYTKPKKVYNKMASNPRLITGMIYAKRRK